MSVDEYQAEKKSALKRMKNDLKSQNVQHQGSLIEIGEDVFESSDSSLDSNPNQMSVDDQESSSNSSQNQEQKYKQMLQKYGA